MRHESAEAVSLWGALATHAGSLRLPLTALGSLRASSSPSRSSLRMTPCKQIKRMRVIAGKFRSRPLQSLRGIDIRPTSDRLRETLFNVVCAGNPGALEGTVWYDLFAGTGAVGIEALSRGAGQVNFVESSGRAAGLIEKNLRTLGIENGFQVMKLDVLAALRKLQAGSLMADFFFLDPPYRMKDAYAQTLQMLSGSPALKATSVVIAEHDRKFDPGGEIGQLRRYRKLEQGDAALSFYKLVHSVRNRG
ncbi:MAG TPA: 16S rRNA (guanine(966)-N(2))-methyltransferase RsmD [Terriglobales bacterium]|nr:16S rRNA (guanine(966)-N(2))-methyltransferase RsmD [Terriglobales bacterium]